MGTSRFLYLVDNRRHGDPDRNFPEGRYLQNTNWVRSLSSPMPSNSKDTRRGSLELTLELAEELDRLNSHVTETKKILKKGGAQGRRLDFMMQEFNREANTLGSKSINTDITASAVELKVLIEQMREQIANIE